MRYRIADLAVEMDVDGRTARQGAAYAAPAGIGPADMTVSCDIERVIARYPGARNRPDDAEYMGTGANFARQLLDFDGLQLHASAIELDGRAWLFSGPPGIGKSTHTEKWLRLFGARIINDDKPALRRLDQGWTAYGTPWSGKGGSRNVSAPVGGLAFLRRGEENRVEPLSPAQALPLLISQTPRVLTLEQTDKMLALAGRLLGEIPVWQLTCRNDDGAAYLARAYMMGERNEACADR